MWLPLIVPSLDVFLLGHGRDDLWGDALSVFIVTYPEKHATFLVCELRSVRLYC